MAERTRSAGSRNTQRTVLVTGATGKQGGAVLRHLRDRGFPVRALTRDPDKPQARALVGRGTEVLRGNLDDSASLTRVLDGVHGVFSVQSLEQGVDAEVREGIALADAAQRSRISHFVYSSVASADRRTGIPHFDSKWRIEEHIRGLGLQHTIMRPVFFMDNWLAMAGMLADGVIRLPLAPDRTLQMIAVDDIGAFATMAFEHPGQWFGRAIDIAGDELSMADIATVLGRATDREIRYEQIPFEALEQRAGHEVAVMYRWFQETGYSVDISALRGIYPRLTTFQNWVRAQDWKGVLASRARTA